MQTEPSPEAFGAFMVVMTSVLEKCKADGAQTRDGRTIDFSALVKRFSHDVLHPKTGVSMSQDDRYFCALLLNMFLDRIDPPDATH